MSRTRQPGWRVDPPAPACAHAGSNRQDAGVSQPLPDRQRITASDRHLAAVSRSLEWARESAERGDYADALAWVRVVEATGTQLPPGFRDQRQVWIDAIGGQPG